MNEEDYGPWHPATNGQKPVHVGWYDVRGKINPNEIVRRYWNGLQWCWEGSTCARAIIQQRQWRGLKEQAK